MYKAQMKFQKLCCFLSLAASAVMFIYSLGLLTDLYDSLYPTMMNPKNFEETMVPGSIIYYNMQGFNKTLMVMALVSVLLSVFLFVMCTHSRRRYYVGNYTAVGLSVGSSLFFAVFCMIKILGYRAQYLTLDFDALAMFSEMWGTPYIESTFWFDAGWAVFGLLILAAGMQVFNLFWKRDMMKAEARLLQEGE